MRNLKAISTVYTSIAAAKKAPLNTSIAERTLSSMNRAHCEKMDKLFCTTHAIAKKGKPFTDFAWMCDLDEMKGLDISQTYRNHTQARNFVGYIAAVEQNNIQKEFSNVNFFFYLIVQHIALLLRRRLCMLSMQRKERFLSNFLAYSQ